MIFDSTNLFSDAQAITVSAASTNIIDLGLTQTPKHAKNALTRDIGKGKPIDVRIQVVETFLSTVTVTVGVQTCAVEGFGSGVVTVLSSPAVPVASLKAGYVFPIQWVPRGTLLQYLRLYYTVATTATAGKITAGFVFANEEIDI